MEGISLSTNQLLIAFPSLNLSCQPALLRKERQRLVQRSIELRMSATMAAMASRALSGLSALAAI